MKNEPICLNLVGKTDAVSLDELFKLRALFEQMLNDLGTWFDSSISDDGFYLSFGYEGKIYSLHCEYEEEDEEYEEDEI